MRFARSLSFAAALTMAAAPAVAAAGNTSLSGTAAARASAPTARASDLSGDFISRDVGIYSIGALIIIAMVIVLTDDGADRPNSP